jgi:hypothetical protein
MSANAQSNKPALPPVNPSTAPFPDFGYMLPPEQIPGVKVFKLSQDFPQDEPKGELPPFFKTDFKTDWKKWLMQVRDYCFEGNIGNASVADDFRVENNKVRKWYHMPWQHYTANGREGFHGLTKEAPVKVGQLATTQTYATAGAWAVGFFNDRGGWKIGQVWKDHAKPNPEAIGEGFPHGTVLFKLLFTSIPRTFAEQQVPFFRNGVWWDAYATYNFSDTTRSTIQVVLTQMDVMVRDVNSLNGWVLGNFQFNGNGKGKAWENLVPVGIMWGQDPGNRENPPSVFPLVKTPINQNLKQTIINSDSSELPPTHLGWNGRLNGPLDNPMSSCFSCHSTAQYPQYDALSPLFDPKLTNVVKPGDDTWMKWFRNIKCGTVFDEKIDLKNKQYSTDFCLQLAESMHNFDLWKDARNLVDLQGGLSAESYKAQKKLLKSAQPATEPTVHSLQRNQ